MLKYKKNLNGYEVTQNNNTVAYIFNNKEPIDKVIDKLNNFIDIQIKKGATQINVRNPARNGGKTEDYGMITIGCFNESGDFICGEGFIL